MKKLLAVCSFSLLVAGCAHQEAGYGSAGGFAPFYGDCLMDSAYSLGPSYEDPCRNGGHRIYPYGSPESTNAIAQRASVVGHARHRPEPRVISRPETGEGSGGSSTTSSLGQGSGSGSGFAASGSHAPSAPAAPPSAGFSSPPASQPAPH
jgi:hypothetical protein